MRAARNTGQRKSAETPASHTKRGGGREHRMGGRSLPTPEGMARHLTSLMRRNVSIGYVFALVGAPDRHLAAQHLTAISLLRSLHPIYPIVSLQSTSVCAWANSRLRVILQAMRVRTICVPPIITRCSTRSPRFAPTYTKFHVWNLTEYDKIVFLDSDLATMHSLDRVVHGWAQDAGTMELRAPLGCEARPRSAWWNTGVWGVTPFAPYFAALRTWLETQSSFACHSGDQSAASACCKGNSYTPLPLEYDVKADTGVTSCVEKQRLPHAAVIHWSGDRKPMGLQTADAMEAPALRDYQTAYLRYYIELSASKQTQLRGEARRDSSPRAEQRGHPIIHAVVGTCVLLAVFVVCWVECPGLRCWRMQP